MTFTRNLRAAAATVALSLFLASTVRLLPAFAQAPEPTKALSNTAPCIDCTRIRVGLPKVVQGPGPGIPDSAFTVVRLPNGRFRGFSATSTTYAIDGDSPFDMAGKPTPVLGPAPRGEYGESGEWIQHVERSGKLIGRLFDEGTIGRAGLALERALNVESERPPGF